MDVGTRTHTSTCAHAHAHAHTHTYTHTHARAHTYLHTRTHVHTRTHALTRTNIHTRMHTHAHTYTCAHTHTHKHKHRVGRTGRAGNKGTAITFINPEDDKYAPDLVKALQESKAPVPQVGRPWGGVGEEAAQQGDQQRQQHSRQQASSVSPWDPSSCIDPIFTRPPYNLRCLVSTPVFPPSPQLLPNATATLSVRQPPVQDLEIMASAFTAKRKAGLVTAHGSGYGGTGFKFDSDEANRIKQARGMRPCLQAWWQCCVLERG